MECVVIVGNYEGNISIPGSKSDSQRALLAASLSPGISMIRNVGICEDELTMISIIQKLGASVVKVEDGFQVEGIEIVPANVRVDVHESGLSARLLSGLFAFSEGKQEIFGDGSILRRKFSFYPKHQTITKYPIGYQDDYRVPLIFDGKIEVKGLIFNGGESSQNISGLLYGFSYLKRKSTFQLVHLKSKPYLDMTIDTLLRFGIHIENRNYEEILIDSSNGFKPCDYIIEGDWSSASYWLVASALGKEISISGLSMRSKQADKQLIYILVNANCIVVKGDKLSIDGKERQPLNVDLTHCPDLFPALTTYAALTFGVSRLSGVHRLANKESNRAEVLIQEFGKLGIQLEIEQDTLIVHGQEKIKGGASTHSHNDHRIAMCLAIVGMFSEQEITIEQAECVKKSYPTFWDDLSRLKSKE